ncbi:MAG TPA: spermidine/putrescine ABC transporter substrate-binding protein, partial [Actinomycetota bacterium]|nr:spermidine/putrescine ABC transporter substrate-binding protein [Actinomycetota bacterium]
MRRRDRLPTGWGRPLSRRELLRQAGRGSLGLAAMSFLAACGVRSERPEQPAAQSPSPLPPKAGELQIANWPLYIDKAKGEPVTPQTFSEEHDVDVTYREVINDNVEFFATIQEPLAQGEAAGWDIIVVTDWLVDKMNQLGYLEQLHHSELPQVQENLRDTFRDPWYDAGNAHSVPWAAGFTGIGYDISLTGRELTSIDDLFDDEWAGRVGLFTEMRDTFGLVLLSLGIEPSEATVEDAERAQQKLLENRDNVRGFYGNEYADQLATGSLAVSMAWSGDIFALQLDNPNLRFALPEQGAMRWVDNMVIANGAEHPTDAHLFMDYVYDPRIAANITEWVWYESPVEP